MFHLYSHLLAAGVPNFSPSFDWPGGDIAKKALNAILGAIALWMLFNIIKSAAQAAHASASGRHGGASGAGTSIILSLLVLVLIFAGAAFINDWVKYLTPA